MKVRILPVSCLALTVVLATLFTAGGPASAQTLYGISHLGADGLSTLHTVDPATGAVTMIGAVGFERCGGMDFDAAGVLYATCERGDGSDTPVLVTVNVATGAGTEVGLTGLSGSVSDISFRADGTLFAYDAANAPTHTLHTINPATGAGTLVGDTGLSFAGGNAMGFNLAGTLYHSQFTGGPNPDLNTLDPATGAPTFISQLPPVTGRFNAMDVNPATGTLFAVLNEGSGGGPRSLATIDPMAGTATVIGATDDGLDALAWLPAPVVLVNVLEIPTLGTLGLVLLSAALALAAGLVLRRS